MDDPEARGSPGGSLGERIRENPFYVLDLRPGCGRAEVEHQGQKLLQMLEMGIAGADRYRTPLGERTRTVELVRRAMDALRDAGRRSVHEPWALLPPVPLPEPPPSRRAPWLDALQQFDW